MLRRCALFSRFSVNQRPVSYRYGRFYVTDLTDPSHRFSDSTTTATTTTATSNSITSVSPITPDAKSTQLLFDAVWQRFLAEHEKQGRSLANISLPGEYVWLMGSPAAGKGTHANAIRETRGITREPIVISQLLKDQVNKTDANNAMLSHALATAKMVDDAEVLALLMEALVQEPLQEQTGVLIDGFPRSETQVEFLKHLYDKLVHLHSLYFQTPHRAQFPRPRFRICVLYVDEATSVARQLQRGLDARAHNDRVRRTGQGELVEERITDFDENLVRQRYHIFKEHYGALLRLNKIFPFHLVQASGSMQQVMERVQQEFAYQSSLELDQRTYESLQHIPIASQVGLFARQALIQRLDTYQMLHSQLFKEAITVIDKLFVPVIKRHAMAGRAVIRCEDEKIVHHSLMIDIIMDVLSERGYHVTFDPKRIGISARVNLETGEIERKERDVAIFTVHFTRHVLRSTNSTK